MQPKSRKARTSGFYTRRAEPREEQERSNDDRETSRDEPDSDDTLLERGAASRARGWLRH